MSEKVTIGTFSRNGLYQVTDTNWDHNGTLRVTVREMVGQRSIDARTVRSMRALARRAISHPEKTRSARMIRSWYANGQTHATFAVSRLDN